MKDAGLFKYVWPFRGHNKLKVKPVTNEISNLKPGKETSNLKPGKAVRSNDIQTKILKDFEDVFATCLYINYNNSLLDGVFPEDLKTAEVVPVYKKRKCTDKRNYRSVSIL